MKLLRGAVLMVCLAILGLAGCGGSSKPTPPPAQAITVSMAGQPSTLTVNAQASLTATVANDSANAGVKWSATCGSSTACGTFSSAQTPSGTATTYTAPTAVPTGNSVTVTATSVTDSTKTATATITITPPPAVTVSISGQPSSMVANTPASLTATVANDSANAGVTWTVSCGSSACGLFNPAKTASGTATTYVAPVAVPSGNTVTVTATSVTDTSKTATATITITAPPISVSLAPSPPSPMTVNTTTRITAIVANDATNAGVNWTVSCGGSSCGSIASAKTASGTATTYTAPIAVPSGNTVTITATSVTDNSKSVSATVTIVGASSAVLYDGTYVYHLAGVNGNGDCFFAGAFTVANGAITGGEQDFTDPTISYSNAITAAGSSLSIASSGNIQVVLATTNTALGPNGSGAITLRGTKVSNSRVLISEYDGYATGVGSIDLQTSAAAPSGGYAFVVAGLDVDQNGRTSNFSIGGILNITGTSLSVSGSVFDSNLEGSPVLGSGFTSGTVSAPDQFGRLSFNLTPSSASGVAQFILTGYIVGPNQIQLIESQQDALLDDLAGTALGQGSNTGAFNASSIAGKNYAFGSTGVDGNGGTVNSVNFAGSLNFSPNLGLSGPLAINDLVSWGEDTITGGSATVDPSGRVTISNITTDKNPLGANYGFQMYLDGNGNALIMGADAVEVSAGPAYLQTNTAPALSGAYSIVAAGSLIDNNSITYPWSAAGAVTVNSGSYSGFTDYNDTATPTPNQSLNGSLNTSSGVISLAGLDAIAFSNPNNFLDYPIDNNRIVMISIDQYLLGLMSMENITK